MLGDRLRSFKYKNQSGAIAGVPCVITIVIILNHVIGSHYNKPGVHKCPLRLHVCLVTASVDIPNLLEQGIGSMETESPHVPFWDTHTHLFLLWPCLTFIWYSFSHGICECVCVHVFVCGPENYSVLTPVIAEFFYIYNGKSLDRGPVIRLMVSIYVHTVHFTGRVPENQGQLKF